jgi:hypothetical protein
MGLGGNAFEWEESSINLVNSSGSTSRGIRGGSWLNDSYYLRSWVRLDQVPNHQDVAYAYINGFRVANLSSDAVVPEPSMMVIGTLFGLGGLVAKRRLRK